MSDSPRYWPQAFSCFPAGVGTDTVHPGVLMLRSSTVREGDSEVLPHQLTQPTVQRREAKSDRNHNGSSMLPGISRSWRSEQQCQYMEGNICSIHGIQGSGGTICFSLPVGSARYVTVKEQTVLTCTPNQGCGASKSSSTVMYPHKLWQIEANQLPVTCLYESSRSCIISLQGLIRDMTSLCFNGGELITAHLELES